MFTPRDLPSATTEARVGAGGRAALLLVLGLHLALGCQPRGGARQEGVAGASGVSVEPVGRPAAPRFGGSALGGDHPLAAELSWRRASAGDPAALEELALREGATGLVAVARGGGGAGGLALAALPHAPDAEAVVAELCGWLRGVEGGDLERLVASVHEILAAPPSDGERLDPPGVDRCVAELIAVTARVGVPATVRDRAVSAVVMAQAKDPRLGTNGLSSVP